MKTEVRASHTAQKELDGIDVLQASCNGYYRSGSGRIVTQWPHNFAEYRKRVDRVDLSSFELGSGREKAAA